MKPNLYRALLACCFALLLGGSIIQTLCGSSFLTIKSNNDWGNDDAYIGYRYAENLAHGKGLVFNPGERVEGYSDILYIAMLAPAFWLTDRDGVYFFSVMLNLLFAAFSLGLFAAYTREKLGDWNALAASLLFALCLPLWVASASGIETCQVLLITLAIWVYAERVAAEPTRRPMQILAALMVLSVLARVDGFLVPGIVVLYLGLKGRMRQAVICAMATMGAQGFFEVWRIAYYGAWLPTTYYVKVTGPLGERIAHAWGQFSKINLFDGMLPYTLILLLAALAAGGCALAKRRPIAECLRFEFLFAPLWILYWFYIGGDHFWDRFLIVLYPLGIYAVLDARRGVSRQMAVYGLVLLAALQAGPAWYVDPRFSYISNKYDCWIGVGKFLGAGYPGRTVAVLPLGKIPFFSGLYAQDMLGLADPVIAHMPAIPGHFEPGHNKFNPGYSLSRHPDLIVDEISPNLDMGLGMTRARYMGAGYHLEYLVDTRRPPRGQPIVPVAGLHAEAISALVAQGFDYAIAARDGLALPANLH